MNTTTPIKIPATRAGTLYDFDSLEVGGPPIVVPLAKRGSLESCCWRDAQRINRRKSKRDRAIFTVRAFAHEGVTKVGCWRIQ